MYWLVGSNKQKHFAEYYYMGLQNNNEKSAITEITTLLQLLMPQH